MAALPERSPRAKADGGTRAGSSGKDSLRQAVREAKQRIESQLIMKALQKHRWNRRLTAEALQISYRSLMYKMKSCNLRDGNNEQPSEE